MLSIRLNWDRKKFSYSQVELCPLCTESNCRWWTELLRTQPLPELWRGHFIFTLLNENNVGASACAVHVKVFDINGWEALPFYHKSSWEKSLSPWLGCMRPLSSSQTMKTSKSTMNNSWNICHVYLLCPSTVSGTGVTGRTSQRKTNRLIH